MPIDPTLLPLSNPSISNNPSKEIWASSGVHSRVPYAAQSYAPDIPNSLAPNTGIQTTTTTTTRSPDDPTAYNPINQHSFYITLTGVQPPLNKALINDGNYFIDDMLVFNKYISYDSRKLITFDPESFLKESIVNFNIYSLEYR
jgi:hypothetical protein